MERFNTVHVDTMHACNQEPGTELVGASAKEMLTREYANKGAATSEAHGERGGVEAEVCCDPLHLPCLRVVEHLPPCEGGCDITERERV
jgi:hypothetical protein